MGYDSPIEPLNLELLNGSLLEQCLSSSNNGVGQGRKLPAVTWTGGHGTRCQIQGR